VLEAKNHNLEIKGKKSAWHYGRHHKTGQRRERGKCKSGKEIIGISGNKMLQRSCGNSTKSLGILRKGIKDVHITARVSGPNARKKLGGDSNYREDSGRTLVKTNSLTASARRVLIKFSRLSKGLGGAQQSN